MSFGSRRAKKAYFSLIAESRLPFGSPYFPHERHTITLSGATTKNMEFFQAFDGRPTKNVSIDPCPHTWKGEKKMLVILENNRNMTQNGKRNETKEVCQKRQNIT